MSDTTQDQLELISSLLAEVETYSLTVEVIYSSLKAMKDNPELEPDEAFAIGHTEWIK